jgi:ferredoxin-NADP reductase
MSFKFARSDSLNSNAGRQENQYLNYKAGQYCVVNLGTRGHPEGPVRSFTMASSPTEEDFILYYHSRNYHPILIAINIVTLIL